MMERPTRFLIGLMVLAILVCGGALAVQAQDYRGNWQRQKNPRAVAEGLAGTREIIDPRADGDNSVVKD